MFPPLLTKSESGSPDADPIGDIGSAGRAILFPGILPLLPNAQIFITYQPTRT